MVTDTTGIRVMTWTELVHLDVTLAFIIAVTVTLVVHLLYQIYLTVFNVVSNGSILLPPLFIKDMDENICIYL